MRVLVTGGAGFIGSHVAQAAVVQGHTVAVVDDLSTGHRANVPAEARFCEVDIRRGEALRKVFDEFRPEAISHQAAQASVSISMREPLRDADVNVVGGLNVLEAARAHGARVVYASTGGALYGEVAEGRRADLTWHPAPLSPYACSKLSLEFYLLAYGRAHGIPHNVLRYANVYGPRQDPHGEAGVVAIFFERLLAGEPITLYAMRESGDAGCVRDYAYVGDVVRANLAALEGRLGDPILNVGTGQGVTTRELATAIAALVGRPGQIVDAPPRHGDLERSVLEVSRFQEVLGAPTSLRDGLSRTADWFRARA